jgi:transposase
MNYITGFNRSQAVLIPETIEQLIDTNRTVRFIDAFVNSLNVIEFGFRDIRLHKNGRPPFHPKDLLKLYIYGYLNKIRSSRGLDTKLTPKERSLVSFIENYAGYKSGDIAKN